MSTMLPPIWAGQSVNSLGSQYLLWPLRTNYDDSLSINHQKQAGVPITTLAPIKDWGYKDSWGCSVLFTSKVSGLSEWSYWQRLQKLKLMSLQSYSERRGLRAIVPPYCKTATAHCQTYYCQSFVFTGLKLWNYLFTKLTTITIKTTGHPPVMTPYWIWAGWRWKVVRPLIPGDAQLTCVWIRRTWTNNM